MLTVLGSLSSFAVLLSQTAQSFPPIVVERGPHHQVVQSVTLTRDEQGLLATLTNSFAQLTPGLNWFNPQTQAYEETQEKFEITRDGYAVAQRGPHKLILAPNVATSGAVDLLTSDGQRFRSHVFGISYFNPVTGQSELIAEVKDTIGELVATNQVVYPDAFTDFSADLRVTYGKFGIEADVILRERPPPPSPEVAGSDPAALQLQILTEFIDPPAPLDRASTTNAEPNRFFIAPNLTDERLEFGAMIIGQGKAFSVDESFDVSDDKAVPVGKTWKELAPGRTFLIESVNYASILPALEALPAAPRADATKPKRKTGRLAELVRERGRRVAAVSPDTGKSIQLAQTGRAARKGFVVDYVILNTIASTTLKSDTTYYVTNTAILSGVTQIEGGTVVKYTNGAQLKFQGIVKCQTSAYRPAVFTSKDDDSVGETISGSTGNPSTNYPASTALYFDNNQSDLKYIRVAHADQAIYYDSDTGYPHFLTHAQIVHCKKGILPHNTAFYVRNVLMNDVLTNFYNTTYNATGYVHHLTANIANVLNGSANITLNVTNSLLVAVTNIGTISGSSNATNSSGSGVFQTVGAGNHYLASGSGYRNAGTTNICDTLKADLAVMTTYPPIVLTNDFTTSTTLSPQAQRDSDTPDLGYHYPPLDYCWSGLNLTNSSTLTLTNGVAVGIYGITGTTLRNGVKFCSEGGPVNLNRLVRYQAVQEQSYVWGSTSGNMTLLQVGGQYSPQPEVRLRFTDIVLPSEISGRRTFVASSPNAYTLALTDCRLLGAYLNIYNDSVSYQPTLALTNNTFERVTFGFVQGYSGGSYPGTYYLRNNLFRGGTLTLYSYPGKTTSAIHDNLFDSVSLTVSTTNNPTSSYNGYATNVTKLPGSSGNDKTVTNVDYQIGPLGGYYYPTSGGHLSQLINSGSKTNAGLVGLYHHTTLVDQTKETNSVLDIGFHYVAVNPAESEVAKVSPLYPDASSSYDGTWTPDKATNGVTTDPGWHNASYTEEPAWLRLDLGSSKNVSRVGYTGRQGTGQGVGNGNGVYRDYKIYVTDSSSTNSANWGTEVAAGQWLWQNGQERRDVEFCPTSGRYVIFRRITADGYRGPGGTDPGYANANEVWIYTRNSMFSTALDYDGDGSPDYYEDRDGDGSVDSGETDWQSSNSGISGAAGLQVFTPLK